MVNHPIKSRCGLLAQQQGHHHEQHRRHHQLDDGANLQTSAGSQGHHDGQDDDAENVVENGSTDHDLPLAGAQITEFTENTGGDADAGGRHRGTRKDRWDCINVEDGHEAKGAEGKGQHHTHHSDTEGLGPHRHQFLQLALETCKEEQGVEPQRGHRLQSSEALVVQKRNLVHRHMGKA